MILRSLLRSPPKMIIRRQQLQLFCKGDHCENRVLYNDEILKEQLGSLRNNLKRLSIGLYLHGAISALVYPHWIGYPLAVISFILPLSLRTSSYSDSIITRIEESDDKHNLILYTLTGEKKINKAELIPIYSNPFDAIDYLKSFSNITEDLEPLDEKKIPTTVVSYHSKIYCDQNDQKEFISNDEVFVMHIRCLTKDYYFTLPRKQSREINVDRVCKILEENLHAIEEEKLL